MANVRFLFSSRPNFFPNQITVIKLVFLYKLNGFKNPSFQCNSTCFDSATFYSFSEWTKQKYAKIINCRHL